MRIAALFLAFLALPLAAQQPTTAPNVKVGTGTDPIEPHAVETIEVPSPLAVEIVIPPAMAEPLEPGRLWRWTDGSMARYSLDKARIARVTIERDRRWKKSKEYFRVAVSLVSEYYSQDVHLRVRLVDGDGTIVEEELWREVTIGSPQYRHAPMAGQPQAKMVEWRIEGEEVQRIILGGAKVRLNLEIDD